MTPSVSIFAFITVEWFQNSKQSLLNGSWSTAFVFQTTRRPYWRSEGASGGGSSRCIGCRCWSWTAAARRWAARTRCRCACASATPMAWPCHVEPWPTRRLVSAPAPSWPFWAASSHSWVRRPWLHGGGVSLQQLFYQQDYIFIMNNSS